jgi:rubrerythrin
LKIILTGRWNAVASRAGLPTGIGEVITVARVDFTLIRWAVVGYTDCPLFDQPEELDRMKKLFTLLTIAVFATAAIGCDKTEESSTKDEEKTTTESTDETAEADKADESKTSDDEGDEAQENEKVAMVDVPAEGKEFDPAVEKSRIPDGTWICDMGTVHWAAQEKPEDGKCPICGMQLTKHEHAGDSPK